MLKQIAKDTVNYNRKLINEMKTRNKEKVEKFRKDFNFINQDSSIPEQQYENRDVDYLNKISKHVKQGVPKEQGGGRPQNCFITTQLVTSYLHN